MRFEWVLALALVATPADLASQLKGYYPNLSCAKLEAKLSVSDSFSFFRTVVPFFWDEMKREAPLGSAPLAKLGGYSAFCAGDPHPENFGLEARSDGSSGFAINDEDDAGICPADLDFLKFLVSARLAWGEGSSTIVPALVDSYEKSLTGDLPFGSDWVKNGGGSGQSDGSVHGDGHGCDRPVQDATLQSALRGAIADFESVSANAVSVEEVCDATKPSGGSGGLPRYDVKYRLESDRGSHRKIQFKGAQRSAVSFFTGDDLAPAIRYPLACALEKQDTGKGICPVVTISGTDFLVRRKGGSEDQAVSLKDFAGSRAQLLQILEDEANALARLHKATLGRSLGELEAEAGQGVTVAPAAVAYSQAFAAVPAGVWDLASQQLVDRVGSTYSELPQALQGFCGGRKP